MSRANRQLPALKRAFDVGVSLVALVVASPLMLAVAAVVLFTIGRPVLFRQTRPGLGGRPFVLRKFRTMLDTTDEKGDPLPDQARLTRFGRFLRSTSLDELPELWNVLTGDMSLVGPRPLLMEYLPLYSERQSRRHEVRPGITGWAQVNGRNALSWEDKLEMDVWYVDNWSMVMDLRILWLTIGRVLRSEGISQSLDGTTPKFRGGSP